ncbi:ribonuclease HI family protein [Nocardioides terrisoli]|uniref:ribonuclease HI family protein n=1 Tax=Nocardioides terrisoli TaxID=3388267 RepID=UPI00287B87EB|nr:ribonuclease HI family protein [Nocardioides marmorisolisilvae]
MTIIAAADGSALGNPGPAGWAWYVDDDCWASGGWAHGTNNMGELTAVLDLLRQTAHADDDLLVYCDSTYAINVVTKWMAGWKQRGWRKRDNKPVLNVEIIKALDEAMAGRRVEFVWVKGHAGHALNEAADRLANAAAVRFRDGLPPEPGPGFPGAPVVDRHDSLAEPGREPAPGPEPDLFSTLDEAEQQASTVAPMTDGDQVIALERSLLTAEVRDDPAALAALLHPRWQEIGASGRIRTREEALSGLEPLPPTELEVVSLTPAGPDALLLLWRAHSETGTRLRSSLWLRDPTQWRQLFQQGTPVGE